MGQRIGRNVLRHGAPRQRPDPALRGGWLLIQAVPRARELTRRDPAWQGTQAGRLTPQGGGERLVLRRPRLSRCGSNEADRESRERMRAATGCRWGGRNSFGVSPVPRAWVKPGADKANRRLPPDRRSRAGMPSCDRGVLRRGGGRLLRGCRAARRTANESPPPCGWRAGGRTRDAKGVAKESYRMPLWSANGSGGINIELHPCAAGGFR